VPDPHTRRRRDVSRTVWSTPKDVDGPTAAFGPTRIDDYLPRYAEVPDEFKRANTAGATWQNVASGWFFSGLHGRLVAKPGIDRDAALRHIQACLTSWEPKHEHKEAGVAYLLSLWFERYEPAEGDSCRLLGAGHVG
jgi:hypothetical protein